MHRYAATMSHITPDEGEPSTGRTEQWAIERRMSLRNVDCVGHGNAVEFNPGMCEGPAAEASSRADPDDRTQTAQRQDQPDELRSRDACRAP